jgi:VWFA-related protein
LPITMLLGLLATLTLIAQQPRFTSGTERIVIDVQVVDKQGKPLPALTADDFEVRVDQGVRPVKSLEFIRAAALETPAAGGPEAPLPPVHGLAIAALPKGRDFILAIDESSFQTRYAPAAVRAARGFVERLSDNDRVGIFTYPVAQRSFMLTTDHDAVLKNLDHVVGTFDPPISRYHLSKSEVVDIEAGDTDALNRVVARECAPQDRIICRSQVLAESHSIAMQFEMQVNQSIGGLRTLFSALNQDPERKTVVIVSGGLLAADRVGARPDVSGIITTMGEMAALANATLYVLHMDSSFLEAFSAANGGGAPSSLMRDMSIGESGLDRLAGTAGGTLVRVQPGGEDRAFQQILRETSAYYLLSVEPAGKDRDGRMHYISVKVKVHGAEVRSRRTVVIPKSP